MSRLSKSNVPQGVPTKVVDRKDQLKIFDSLPKKWRYLINNLPSDQNIASVKHYLDVLGEVNGYNKIIEIFKQKFPEWDLDKEGYLNARPVNYKSRRKSRNLRRTRQKLNRA